MGNVIILEEKTLKQHKLQNQSNRSQPQGLLWRGGRVQKRVNTDIVKEFSVLFNIDEFNFMQRKFFFTPHVRKRKIIIKLI